MRTRRGTAIIETEQGILLNAMAKDSFLLPGGGANYAESRINAAVRELYEETGLRAYHAMFLFSFQSRKNDHKVFWVQAIGVPRPMSEIERIGYFQDGVITHISDRKGTQYRDATLDQASESTREILRLFGKYKLAHADFFEAMMGYAHAVEQRYSKHEFLLGE
ncbi:MAG: NUDIX domain-containing protein [Candidatus Kapaibacteriota bacterium]